jgi:hypothetical protein
MRIKIRCNLAVPQEGSLTLQLLLLLSQRDFAIRDHSSWLLALGRAEQFSNVVDLQLQDESSREIVNVLEGGNLTNRSGHVAVLAMSPLRLEIPKAIRSWRVWFRITKYQKIQEIGFEDEDQQVPKGTRNQ